VAQISILNYHIVKFKFYNFLDGLDANMVYTKAVSLNTMYNFLVDNFFKDHFDVKILIFKILDFFQYHFFKICALDIDMVYTIALFCVGPLSHGIGRLYTLTYW
jgi:hypothetical protein